MTLPARHELVAVDLSAVNLYSLEVFRLFKQANSLIAQIDREFAEQAPKITSTLHIHLP